MSIRIVYPNPFTGLAAFAGGATEAYNAGRINSQNQQAAAEYQAAQQQAAQDYQLYSQVGGALSNLGTAAIFAPILAQSINPQQYATPAPTALGAGKQVISAGAAGAQDVLSLGPANYAARTFADEIAGNAINPQAAFGPDVSAVSQAGIPPNLARGVVAANVLENVLPGVSQLGQIPLQQYVSNQNAARAFQYDQAAAQADYGRRQQFFDYTRAARNEDQFFETFGATPAQSQDVGRAFYQSAPAAQQQQLAGFYGYSPSQIGSLPQSDQNRFYGSLGIRRLQAEQAQNEIDARMQVQRVISGERGFQEFAQGLEVGVSDLHPIYKPEYTTLQQKNAEIAKQMTSGEITREQGLAALRENSDRMDSYLRSVPEWGRIKPAPTPQEQFDKSIVQDKKTGKRMIASIGKSGVTWKPLDDNKEEKAVPNFKSAEEAQQWFSNRTFEVTTPDGKKVKKYLNPNGGLVDIESKDDPLPKPPTLSDVTREMADMVQFLMTPRTVTNADGEKTAIPAMKYDEAMRTAKTMMADSAEIYGAFASRSAALPYALRDTKESIEGARKAEGFRAMSQKFLESVPPILRPELARQLALEMGRQEPVQPNSVFMGGGQLEPQPQPTPVVDRRALEAEARAILQKHPVLSEAPQEARDRIAQIKQQLQGR